MTELDVASGFGAVAEALAAALANTVPGDALSVTKRS